MTPQLTACSEPSTSDTNNDEASIADEYLTNIINHRWAEAYKLTSPDFQQKIPLEAFSANLQSSGFADNIVEFQIADTVTENTTSKVEVTLTYQQGKDESSFEAPYYLTLTRQQGKWAVELLWEDFLAFKLDTQSSLAVTQNKDISIAIQYLLLYPEAESLFRCRVRLDIQNESDKTITWKFAVGSTDSYLKDNDTGVTYSVGSGGGASGKTGVTFGLSKEDDLYKVTAASGAQGSVFIYFNGIPNTIKQFDMVLGSFSFPDTEENWTVSFKNVPFAFDIAPQ